MNLSQPLAEVVGLVGHDLRVRLVDPRLRPHGEVRHTRDRQGRLPSSGCCAREGGMGGERSSGRERTRKKWSESERASEREKERARDRARERASERERESERGR